jgi:hypothetical protein
MEAESNDRFQALHRPAGNAICALVPPAPAGTTLEERLRSVSVRVVEVANYCIRLGATIAQTAAQLWLGEDLTRLEPGFPIDLTFEQCDDLVSDFFAMVDGVLVTVNVEDIICNAPHMYFDCNLPLHPVQKCS